MNTFKKIVLVGVIFSTLALSIVAATEPTAESSSEIQQLLETMLVKEGTVEIFSTIQFSYLPHNVDQSIDFVVGTQGFNSTEPATTEDLFGWGSITKEFTTSLLFQLESAGKLSFEDTLETVFPEYFTSGQNSTTVTWPEGWKGIEISQLLNMSSGIPDYLGSMFFLVSQGQIAPNNAAAVNLPWTAEEMVGMAVNVWNNFPEECRSMGACFEPGTEWYYSNTDYQIAGMIASKLHGGEAIQDVFNEYILDRRSDSTNTVYLADSVLPANILENMPQAYTNGLTTELLNVSNFPWNALSSAGGLIGSMSSLVKMIKQEFSSGFIEPTQLHSLMQTNFLVMDTGKPATDVASECQNMCYGLGVAVFDNPNFGVVYTYHGQALGFKTVYMYLPCYDMTIAISINGADATNKIPLLSSAETQILEILEKRHPQWFVQAGDSYYCPFASGDQDGFLA